MTRYDYKKTVSLDLFNQLKDSPKIKTKTKPQTKWEWPTWLAEYRQQRDRCIELKQQGKTDEEIISILGL